MLYFFLFFGKKTFRKCLQKMAKGPCLIFLETLMVVVIYRLIFFFFFGWRNNNHQSNYFLLFEIQTPIFWILVRNRKCCCLSATQLVKQEDGFKSLRPTPSMCYLDGALKSLIEMELPGSSYINFFVDLLLNGCYPVVMYGWKLWLEKKTLIV